MKAIVTLLATASFAALTCSAAQAQSNPPGLNPEHYACYRVSPARGFPLKRVILKDQFGQAAGAAVQEASLCAPVSKNGEPIKDERTHLLCYVVKMNKSASRKVLITNQFGRFIMKVGPITQLCVPSIKTLQ
jgi:hypothetical protein